MADLRIIGIDPGLRRMGWGVIDVQGSRLTHVAHGVVTSAETDPMAQRLLALRAGLTAVLDEWRPEAAAVEHTFVNKDAAGTLKLGQARAIALLVPAEAGLAVAEYAPNQVKKCVVGVGHAGKEQIAAMVGMLLPRAQVQQQDAADALAVAITHAHLAGAAARLDAALRAAG